MEGVQTLLAKISVLKDVQIWVLKEENDVVQKLVKLGYDVSLLSPAKDVNENN